ncbi:hypothetical protein [Aliikangiella coralliicola]|nr:hypothetical protein [Aliikangiella coralliicola]
MLGLERDAENMGKVCSSYCHQCKQRTIWEFGRLTQWIKLLSLKAISFKKEYFIFCEKCGDDFELRKSEFKQLEKLINSNQSVSHSQVKNGLFKRIYSKQLSHNGTIPFYYNSRENSQFRNNEVKNHTGKN